MTDNDDFWGGTPDWTNDTPRPARGSRRRGGDSAPAGTPTGLGARAKALWSSAMSSGADATREHRIVDATLDPTPAVGQPFEDELGDRAPARSAADDLLFDIDDTFPTGPTGWSGDDWHESDQSAGSEEDRADAGGPVLDDADFAPVNAARSDADRARAGGVDPLLARIGAAVVVLTLIVPLGFGLRSNDMADELVAGAGSEAVATTPVAPIEASPDTPQAAEVPETQLDPSQLPPAVPVRTEASDVDTDAASDGEIADAELVEPSTSASTSEESAASIGSDDMTQQEPATTTADATDADDAPAVSPKPTTALAAASCGVDYTVVPGDFWIRLADAADVALADLLSVNDATVDTPLYPGSEICLPVGADTPAPPATTAPKVTSTTTTSTATTQPATTQPATTQPATTQPATTQPATTQPVATVPAGPADVEAVIREVWPDELEDRALEIAFRESRYVPTAKNFCCYGLFQMYWEVHRSWLGDLGITSAEQLYDPATNARAAYALYQRAGGWGPWGF